MVYIDIIQDEFFITLNCHKLSEDGESFQLVISPRTLEVVKRPPHPDIDATVAYYHVCELIEKGEPLPEHTVAAWG